jgi:hypothetical protein
MSPLGCVRIGSSLPFLISDIMSNSFCSLAGLVVVDLRRTSILVASVGTLVPNLTSVPLSLASTSLAKVTLPFLTGAFLAASIPLKSGREASSILCHADAGLLTLLGMSNKGTIRKNTMSLKSIGSSSPISMVASPLSIIFSSILKWVIVVVVVAPCFVKVMSARTIFPGFAGLKSSICSSVAGTAYCAPTLALIVSFL